MKQPRKKNGQFKKKWKRKFILIITLAFVMWLGYEYFVNDSYTTIVNTLETPVEDVVEEIPFSHQSIMGGIQSDAINIREESYKTLEEAYDAIARLTLDNEENVVIITEYQSLIEKNNALIADYNVAIDDARKNIIEAEEIIMDSYIK